MKEEHNIKGGFGHPIFVMRALYKRTARVDADVIVVVIGVD